MTYDLIIFSNTVHNYCYNYYYIQKCVFFEINFMFRNTYIEYYVIGFLTI